MEPDQQSGQSLSGRGEPPADLLHSSLAPVAGGAATPAGVARSQFAAELLQIANAANFEPQKLIDKLKEKPALDFLYAQSARVAEGYSLEEHTLMVLRQYERYLAGVGLPSGFSAAEMRIALALHDIGKPIPLHKRDQHEETLKVIDSLRADLPVSDQSWPVMLAIIGGDPLGGMLKGLFRHAPREARKAIGLRVYQREDLEFDDLRQFAELVDLNVADGVLQAAAANTASDIKQRAILAGIPAEQFLELLLVYYRSDTSAYSYDAWRSGSVRGFPGLEYLYSLNPDFKPADRSNLFQADSGGLVFAPGVAVAIDALRSAVKGC